MIYKYLKTCSLLTLIILFNCGGSGGDDSPGGGGNPDAILPPEAAILISPLKNEECNQGNIISDTHSSVLFEWNKSSNTNSYTLVLKNLDSNTTEEKTTNSTKLSIDLLRGISYSWQIISKATKTTTTASSETWNLFNAGVGVENYAPFPAEAVSPAMGSLTDSPVNIEWLGNDLDNDIASYDLYLDINTPPTQLQTEGITDTSVDNIALTADTVYYWMVVTQDEAGNTSKSPIFEFRTNL